MPPPRMNMLNLEECELLGDSKYRAYISQVDKALKNFEYTSEWADLISALGKLNKVLSSHVKYPIIPKRVTIGKRLAQCLHPALPSGVHLKALETYDIIFKCIGTPRLAADLFTYSAGIFPLLGYAAMNVKPTLLTLYETHFVPLGKHIKPALLGLLLGVLPGLEEGSEYFDRTFRLLDEFCEAADVTYFHGCLWECVLASPSVRLPAINYVLSHYNRRKSMEDQLFLMGTNIDLLVEAMCTSVQDASVLVQRSALDLLLIGFPMHNSQLTRPDMVKLITASVKVLLRRDMSLNRRLYAWLLGTDASGNALHTLGVVPAKSERRDSSGTQNSDPELDYFQMYSRELLITAVKNCIHESPAQDPMSLERVANLKPFRILISLLDKPEIGVAILEDILLDVFRCMYKECMSLAGPESSLDDSDSQSRLSSTSSQLPVRSRKKEQQKAKNDGDKSVTTEVIKTANLLFGAFEPYYIWDFIGRTFEKTCENCAEAHRNQSVGKGDMSLKELCQLVDFLLDKVSLETYQEIQTEHLPDLLRTVTTSLMRHCDILLDSELTDGLGLCSKLLGRVQPSINPVSTSEDSSQQGSPAKRAFLFKPDADENTFSESDVFVSADSDNGDENSSPERKTKSKKLKQKTDTDDSNVDSLKMDDNDDKDNSFPSEEVRPRSGTGGSTLSDISSDSFNEGASRSEDTESFNDFVQYGDTVSEVVTPVKIPHSPKCPLQKQPSGDKCAQTLMQSCVSCFQKFFARLVSSRVITDKELPHVLLQQLIQPPDVTRDYYNIPHCNSSPSEEDDSATKGPPKVTRVVMDRLPMETCQTFSAACQMLVDFSSFPMFCTNYHKVLQSSFKTGQSIHFPEWLQLLITCACFIGNFHIQSVAISTLLDLISLTKSVMEESESKVDQGQDEEGEGRRRSASEGTVSVVIIPSLPPKHLIYLNEKTYFYKILALNLWDHLGEWTPQCHTRSVELLFQLHQLAPNPWICEDVIGNSLLSDDKSMRIGACKRFAVLWHLLRDKISGWGSGKAIRAFDRSMFVMMDSLQSDTHPCRAIAQTWLTHTIQRGDIARLLEPILLILFHPDTARISIQHVNIHQPKKLRLVSETSDNQSECSETKIYAISSEGGNVIYHVSNSGKPFSKKTSEELRSFALTSISDSGVGAEMISANVETEFHFDKVNPTDLNLRVNPFGSDHSLDRLIFDGYDIPSFRGAIPQRVAPPVGNKFPDLQNIRRLDTETCKKEGIFFDDHDSDEDNEASPTEIPEPEVDSKESKSDDIETASEVTEDQNFVAEDVVREILEDIMDSVTVSDPEELDGTLVGSYRSSDAGNSSSRHRSMSTTSIHSLGADDILNAVDSMSESDIDGDKLKKDQEEVPSVHPLHTHILLYAQKYDSQRTVYALSCLKAILSATPRLVTCAVSTTSLSNASTPHLTQLQNLLIRHRRSVFGKNFFSEVPSDIQATFRTAMFIEILISVCLYFIRSYYPNLMMSKMTEQELNGNKEVQILSCEILMLLLSELINVAKESGRGFSTYINDLLARCKVQKALLHCVLASVYNARIRSNNREDPNNFTDALISFNEDNMDINTNETFQIKLLNLLHVVIVLEDQIRKSKSETEISSPLPTEWEKIKLNFQPPLSSVRFVQSRPIVYQGMLLSAILGALKQQHLSHMHRHWVTMVTSAMPYLNKALSHVVVTVVNQLCRNLELLSQIYELGDIYESTTYQPSRVPPDHLVTLLEAMTTICHYCLLDNAQQEGSVGQPLPGNPNSMSDSATAGHILSNLISVFNPYANNREPSPAKDATPTVNPVIDARRHLLNILPRILASLADLWKSVKRSEDTQGSSGKDRPSWTIGMPKSIRKYILEFLSPITKHHGVNLMASVAIVWNDRRQRGGGNSNKRNAEVGLSASSYPSMEDIFVEREFLNRMVGTKMPPSRLHLVLPQAGEDQLLLVDLISSVKVLPTDTLIQMVKLVLKQPPAPSADKNKKRTPVEVSLLQFFYAYVQRTPGSQLIDSWASLLSLLKDGLQLMLLPSGVFLLLVILNEFVRKLPSMFEDRKDQKELQEITQKLLEACSETAGSSLTQTTFFRRNLAVKPGPQVDVTAVDAEETTTDLDAEAVVVDVVPPTVAPQPKQVQEANRQYSVQALVILAELTAGLLDVVYRSDEKDRVVALLNSIMHNVFPYLKNHSSHNLPSFRACCQMLGSLSSYPYTRKAWKKEAFELLMDHAFFQMDEMCIPYWRVILDNLMTHDKTTFKDLLARVTVNQGAALNLFSSKDAEFEQKAMLLKRMSFTIFCSEVDQYQKVMPEIQERLSDSLRMPTVPSLQAQVFLCFRVLILRISSQHLTSLWPTIITELVHVLLQIEQELSPEVEESKSQAARMGNVDPSWALGNGLNAHTNPGWLKLYLAACKLLDLALVLPTEQLPQFQLYRWAFTGDPGGHTTEVDRKRFKDLQPSFVPHVIRLARLMTHKFGEAHMLPRALGRPLLSLAHIKSLKDLHPFFHTVASVAQSGESLLAAAEAKDSKEQSLPKSISTPELRQIETARQVNNHRLHRAKTAQVEIEQIIEWDFLEALPKK